MIAPDFWVDPRLSWPGSGAEMREALLYWVAAAPTFVDMCRLINRNADLFARLDCTDRKAIGEVIQVRLREFAGESDAQ